MESKYYVSAFLMALGILIIVGLGRAVMNTGESSDRLVVDLPNNQDFSSAEQGTAIFEFVFPKAQFKIDDRDADVVRLFNSQKVSGLKVGYFPKEKVLLAGLPVLRATPVDLFDGEKHVLSYSFDKEKNFQALILDSEVLASGVFSGVAQDSPLTGFAVYHSSTVFESNALMNVTVS